jgi:hypothetical protein
MKPLGSGSGNVTAIWMQSKTIVFDCLTLNFHDLIEVSANLCSSYYTFLPSKRAFHSKRRQKRGFSGTRLIESLITAEGVFRIATLLTYYFCKSGLFVGSDYYGFCQRSSEALNKVSVCQLFELGRPGVWLKRSWTLISFIFFEELTKTIYLLL